ncbi:MAG: site-specific DNA-methyltransferase, partial [Acidobacteria bacterium]|nr:site-specific DNA-methyltransferase [Acidobacteriota bacterium]
MVEKKKSEAKPRKKPIEQYEHKDKKRLNNPPVGLVDAHSEAAEGRKKYAYDPHLDPTLQWAGKAERTSFEIPTVSLHVHERIDSLPFKFNGKVYHPGPNACWKTTVTAEGGLTPGMERLARSNRLVAGENQLRFKSFLDDFGFVELSNWWDSLGGASEPVYVVQTNPEILQRCLLMTTDPGDLVLDITCGSGTT